MANKKMKWFSIATLACAASLCVGFGAANVTADAEATFAITATSVRLDDTTKEGVDSGLRFKVDVPEGAEIENAYTRISLTTAGGEDYTTDVPTTVYRADGGWNAVLLDIPASDYVTEVTAQAFATIDGEACQTKAVSSSIAATALKCYSTGVATMGDVKQYIQFEEATTKTYTFANYPAGTQYAEETHKLDDYVTLDIKDCHLTSQLRIYSSSTNNGVAIIKCDGLATGLVLNAGNKVDTVNVYGSNDNGVKWTLIQGVSVTATSYKDYTVSFNGAEYQQLKLDVAGANQVRLQSMKLTYKSMPVPDDIKAEREAANLAASVVALTTNRTTETGSFDLPTVEGAEKVEWFLKEASAYANVMDNKLNVTSLPEIDSEDETLTLYAKVTAKENNATATAQTKEFTFTIVAPTSQQKVEQTVKVSFSGISSIAVDKKVFTSYAPDSVITISGAQGTHTNTKPTYYAKGTAVRFYAGNTLTISAVSGYTIVSVKLTYSEGAVTGYANNTAVTVNANSVTINTFTKTTRVQAIEIVYSN